MKYLFIVFCVVLLAACSPRQEPLNIAGGTYLGYQPFFLGQSMSLCPTCPPNSNFIGGQPMSLHMLPSTTTVLRLFQAGELDGVLLTVGEAITLHQQSAASVCIAEVLSYSENADAMLVREGFDPSQPFVVGYEQSPFGAYMLSRAVTLLGWDASLINVRFVSPKQHVSALLNEEVDALITFEPYVTQLRAKNAQTVFSGASMPGEILDVFVVTKKAYAEHTEVIHWLMDDYWSSGVQALKAATPEVMRELEMHTGVSSIDLPRSLADIYFFDRTNRNEMTIEALNALIARFNTYKNIPAGEPILQRCDALEGSV